VWKRKFEPKILNPLLGREAVTAALPVLPLRVWLWLPIRFRSEFSAGQAQVMFHLTRVIPRSSNAFGAGHRESCSTFLEAPSHQTSTV